MITEKDYCSSTDISHRKKFAQFFTPKVIANFMADWIIGNSRKVQSILEPAFGLGVFSRSLLNKDIQLSITGFDIDNHIFNIALSNFSDNKEVTLILDDYITSSWNESYDGIICNPPYMKFHDYDNKRAIPLVNSQLGLRLNKFTNIYTLFLLKALSQLKKDGRCAFITPSEFLNADYGVEVKRYLKNTGMRIHFIIIDFEENIFDDAMTTACITLIENKPSGGTMRFSLIKNPSDLHSALSSFKDIAYSDLFPEEKWKKNYQDNNSSRFKHLTDFSNYARVSRGIATGANKYFTITRSKAYELNIPQDALLKCICHCSDISKNIFSEEDFTQLSQNDKTVYLFKGQGNEMIPEVQDYIRIGEKAGIHSKHLCSKRNPWYALEKRSPAPIWVSVFSRRKIKFVRNEANVSNLTTFHCMYVTNMFIDIDVFFAYLLTDIAHQVLLDNSRQYGNGLTKFEPNDINNAKIVDFDILSDKQISDIKYLYSEYKKNEDPAFIKEINRIFVSVFCDIN
ncbi:MAG: SAM-dependent methyltransferase [Muribaculaceae bacterium]|nr:SAM-dependent methyltransferase [Muribaculaceae bacterium]